MLRACLKKRNPLNILQKDFTKSLFTSKRSFFSNQILDEGEYIDGDIDLGLQTSANQSSANPKDFEKKFVTFENLKQNLVPPPSKISRVFKADIPNSIKNLSGKFKFELAEDDEFNQELRNRKTQQEEIAPEKVRSKPADVRQSKKVDFKTLLDRVEAKIVKPDVTKNLVKINYPSRTIEARDNDPLRISLNAKIKHIEDNAYKSIEAIDEFRKGEEGIDRIEPSEAMKKAEINEHLKLIKEVYEMRETYPRGTVDHDKLYQWRIQQELNARIHQEDPEVEYYPGSSKGPHPNDDPEFFVNWLYTTLPKDVKAFYQNYFDKKQSDREKVGNQETQVYMNKHLLHVDTPAVEMGTTNPERSYLMQSGVETAISSFIDTENGELSPLPDHLLQDYQSAQETIEKWAIFRLYPILNKWVDEFPEAMEEAQQGEDAVPPCPPSLFRYYNLLPEISRNHPIIINLVRGLEFHKHGWTLEQKEWALNYACEFTVPMDPILESAVNEAVITHKYHLSSWEEAAIMEAAEGGGDRDRETAGIPGSTKRRSGMELDLNDIIKIDSEGNKEGPPEHLKDLKDWSRPSQMDPETPEEDPFPVLPLQYYDNDDGFWNNYIGWKENRYAELPPVKNLMKFKH